MRTIVLILLLGPVLACAQSSRLNFTGFLDSYHAVRSQAEHEWMSSRSRFRAELTMRSNNAYFFTSINATYNNLLPGRTGFQLRESYFDYNKDKWNLKAGRQIVSWGVADGLQVTDMLTPMDMTEFLAQDYDDIRMPVNAIRVKYMQQKWNIELLCIPLPEFSILPMEADNPWSMLPANGEQKHAFHPAQVPDKSLANSELGLRFSFYLPGVDFTLSAMHTWNKTPAFLRSFSPAYDTLFLQATHQRVQVLGFDFSIPKGQFVIRGEGGIHFHAPHEAMDDMQKPSIISSPTLKGLIGLDWYPGNDWTLTSQFLNSYITDYQSTMLENESSNLMTLGITKKVFRSTLTLSTFLYMDVDNKAFFDRSYMDYALNDEIHLALGYDWFHGEQGMFALYRHNSEFWLKAKYSF